MENESEIMPDYTGAVENPDKLLIQKSNPLLSLSETDMTLAELKILDAYLSRINSHEPDKRYVRFEKGELEYLLGVTRILPKDLDKRINNLFQVVTIKDKTKLNGFKKIALFEKVECGQDENGLWQVDLICTPSAMEYIFNIENIGYLKYRLKSVTSLTSRYSYSLYLLLEDYCYRKTLEISIKELKKFLNCTAVRYNEFKFFNSEILKKCHKEINKKTDISYNYTTIKKGRNVFAIRFEIYKKPYAEDNYDMQYHINQEKCEMPERPPLPPVRKTAINGNDHIIDLQEQIDFAASNERFFNQICNDETLNFFANACCYEFLPHEMKIICELLYTFKVPHVDFPDSLEIGPDEIDAHERFLFLNNQYFKFYSYVQWKTMTREQRFKYFHRMLLNLHPNQS